jgi:selenocysteine lyase/cysteine desulfurase
LRSRLDAIDGVIVRDKGSVQCGIVTFDVGGVDATVVKSTLAASAVTVNATLRASTLLDMTQRHLDSMVRASVHYFNTEEEVDRAAELVGRIVRDSVE